MSARQLTGLVRIHGVDDEPWPFEDETVTAHRQVNVHLTDARPMAALRIKSVRWGGECRVEVDATATLDPGEGNIHISGKVRLFEGVSEDTNDLEDEQVVDFVVSPIGLTRRTYQVKNRETGGGDHASVLFRLSSAAQEPSDATPPDRAAEDAAG